MKRRCGCALAVLVGFACLVVWLEPTQRTWGWLWRESFYQDRPTHYWSREIQATSGSWLRQLLGQKDVPSRDAIAVLRAEPDAVPVLRELLHDRSDYVRAVAAFALYKAKATPARELVPALGAGLLYSGNSTSDALRNNPYEIRYRAASILSEIASDAEPAVPALVRALTDQGFFVGSQVDSVPGIARRTLVAIGQPAVPALVEALHSADPGQRRQAAARSRRHRDRLADRCSRPRRAAERPVGTPGRSGRAGKV